MTKIKILQINADNFGKGGMSVIIWRFMQNIDQEIYSFSFLSEKESVVSSHYKDEITQQKGEIHVVGLPKKKSSKYFAKYREVYKILEQYRYGVIHINVDASFSALPYLLAAKKYKKNAQIKAIVHAHTTSLKEKTKFETEVKILIHRMLRAVMINLSDDYIACSNEAAKFMYNNKKVNILPNGLDIESYKFINRNRELKRREMNVLDKVVVGHVGRFSFAKNHEFLIEVFEKICDIEKDSELWLIGEGEKEEEIRNVIIKKKIEDKVKFLGTLNNMQEYLSAMDVLVFPSKFEGMPLVLAEAQVNKLPVVCAAHITNQVIFSDKVLKIDLAEPAEKWAEIVIDILKKKREEADIDNYKISDFDIKTITKDLEKIYLK